MDLSAWAGVSTEAGLASLMDHHGEDNAVGGIQTMDLLSSQDKGAEVRFRCFNPPSSNIGRTCDETELVPRKRRCCEATVTTLRHLPIHLGTAPRSVSDERLRQFACLKSIKPLECQSAAEAVRLLRKSRVKPSIACFHELMRKCVAAHRRDIAIEAYEDMLIDGVPPQQSTLDIILPLLVETPSELSFAASIILDFHVVSREHQNPSAASASLVYQAVLENCTEQLVSFLETLALKVMGLGGKISDSSWARHCHCLIGASRIRDAVDTFENHLTAVPTVSGDILLSLLTLVARSVCETKALAPSTGSALCRKLYLIAKTHSIPLHAGALLSLMRVCETACDSAALEYYSTITAGGTEPSTPAITSFVHLVPLLSPETVKKAFGMNPAALTLDLYCKAPGVSDDLLAYVLRCCRQDSDLPTCARVLSMLLGRGSTDPTTLTDLCAALSAVYYIVSQPEPLSQRLAMLVGCPEQSACSTVMATLAVSLAQSDEALLNILVNGGAGGNVELADRVVAKCREFSSALLSSAGGSAALPQSIVHLSESSVRSLTNQSGDHYVLMVEDAVVSLLAQSNESRRAVSVMMTRYDTGSGGSILVPFSSLMTSVDSKEKKPDEIRFLLSWLGQYSSWFKLLPFTAFVSAGLQCSPGLPYTSTAHGHLRRTTDQFRAVQAHHKKCVFVVATDDTQALCTSWGLKPVVTLASLVQRVRA